ncbi:MAG: hypothetical protein AB3N09_00710 [Tateyamaria sp.]
MKKTLVLTAIALMMGTTTLADTTRPADGTFQVANLFDRLEQSALWSSLTDSDRWEHDDDERYADRDDDWDDDDDDDDDRDDDRDDRDDRDDDGDDD